MTGAGEPAACHPQIGCVTCADEAVEMRALEDRAEGPVPCAAADGAVEEIDVTLVGPVRSGDVVLAHARVAIGRPARSAP